MKNLITLASFAFVATTTSAGKLHLKGTELRNEDNCFLSHINGAFTFFNALDTD